VIELSDVVQILQWVSNVGVAVVISVYLVYKLSNDFQHKLEDLVEKIDNLTIQLTSKLDQLITEDREFRKQLIEVLLRKGGG